MEVCEAPARGLENRSLTSLGPGVGAETGEAREVAASGHHEPGVAAHGDVGRAGAS